VNAGYHDKLMFLSVLLQQGNDLEASHRIKPTGGFIEEKDIWCGDQLACDANTSLLASGYALTNRCADQGISLLLETKAVDQCPDSAVLLIV
jgi:hypothetical protein